MLLSKVPLWRPLASPGRSLHPQVPVHSATMSKKSSTLAHTAATLFRAFARNQKAPCQVSHTSAPNGFNVGSFWTELRSKKGLHLDRPFWATDFQPERVAEDSTSRLLSAAGHAGCVSVPARSDPRGGHSFLRPSVEEAWGPGWVGSTAAFYLQESVEALHVGSPSHDCSATGAFSDPAKPAFLGWFAEERLAIARFAAPVGCARIHPKNGKRFAWSVESRDNWLQDTEP